MYIKLGTIRANRLYDSPNDYMILSEVPSSGMSFESPVKIRTIKELNIWFGKSYQEVFEHIDLSGYYCFKDLNNFILEGHFSYYLYSFFYIQFFPCTNSTESKKCKPLEKIDYYLKNI